MTMMYGDLYEFLDYWGREFAEKCTNCGECLLVCPVYPLIKSADKGPKAVIEKVNRLLKEGEVSEEAYELAYSCTGACGLCAKVCPEGLAPYMVFVPAKAKLARAGKEPPPEAYQYTPGHRYNYTKVFSSLQIKPSEERWMREAPPHPEPVEVVFFTGCGAQGMPNIVLETVAILEGMGLNFVTLAGGDLCCGSGFMQWGDLEAAQNMGQTFVSTIASFGAKKAAFLCDGCRMMCAGILPATMNIPFEPYELAQFLAENIDRIPFSQKVNRVVTLHDSCGVARFGTPEAGRRLLQAIPGLTLVEMEHNRQDSLCCGGLANITRSEITEPIRRAPLEEAKATGADTLATICNGCQQAFAPFEDQYHLEVRSYISLVAEAIGVRYEDKFKKYINFGDVDEVIAAAKEYIDASDYSVEEMKRILPEYLNRFCLKHSGSSSPEN